MPSNWSKGLTKETHPSVRKISETMKRKKIDNFYHWREKMKKAGKIKSTYPPFDKTGDLAEFIGVILGDGHIGKFPRTESLSLFSNSNNKGFIARYSKLMQQILDKKPAIAKRGSTNCTMITIYQKNISKRLRIPSGARKNHHLPIPRWISRNKKFIIRYLRGLFEAEGSYCIHKPTSTHKLIFYNSNNSLLTNVHTLLVRFGFHVNRSGNKVQVSRKEEVEKLRKLLQYRYYQHSRVR